MKMKSNNNNALAMEGMVQDLNYVAEVMQRISEKKPLADLLNEIMESCKVLMNAEASSLLIYDEKEDILQFQVATGKKGAMIKNIVCKMGEGIAGWVAQESHSTTY
jgi:sigma-B regulation protein RsbU (phosphoserine phosphatase)